MAEVVNDETGERREIADGSFIREACKEMDIPFSCEDGYCGICCVDIIEGEENLSELSEPEQDLDMSRKRRLCCQSKIKSGIVKIRY